MLLLLCCSGTVVRCGPGKAGEDGERKAPRVAPGDRVIYFKYAGDPMQTPAGELFTVLHEQDILAKL
jgi:chaperonin GroES